jgi:hypothetical protein
VEVGIAKPADMPLIHAVIDAAHDILEGAIAALAGKLGG